MSKVLLEYNVEPYNKSKRGPWCQTVHEMGIRSRLAGAAVLAGGGGGSGQDLGTEERDRELEWGMGSLGR